MRPAILALAAASVAACAVWLGWPEEPPPAAAQAATAAARPSSASAISPAPAWPPPWPPAERATAAAAVAADTPLSAALSLAQTRAHGDPEAPPIARETAPPPRPTAEELANPKAYLGFESRQTAQVHAAYLRAVDSELPKLRDDIARGRAMGIAADHIAKAEDKARGLEAMRTQLLKDHPELGR